jgi:hypothetical protein
MNIEYALLEDAELQALDVEKLPAASPAWGMANDGQFRLNAETGFFTALAKHDSRWRVRHVDSAWTARRTFAAPLFAQAYADVLYRRMEAAKTHNVAPSPETAPEARLDVPRSVPEPAKTPRRCVSTAKAGETIRNKKTGETLTLFRAASDEAPFPPGKVYLLDWEIMEPEPPSHASEIARLERRIEALERRHAGPEPLGNPAAEYRLSSKPAPAKPEKPCTALQEGVRELLDRVKARCDAERVGGTVDEPGLERSTSEAEGPPNGELWSAIDEYARAVLPDNHPKTRIEKAIERLHDYALRRGGDKVRAQLLAEINKTRVQTSSEIVLAAVLANLQPRPGE